MKILTKYLYSKSSVTPKVMKTYPWVWHCLVTWEQRKPVTREGQMTVVWAERRSAPGPGQRSWQVLKPHSDPGIWRCSLRQRGNWGANWSAKSLGSEVNKEGSRQSVRQSVSQRQRRWQEWPTPRFWVCALNLWLCDYLIMQMRKPRFRGDHATPKNVGEREPLHCPKAGGCDVAPKSNSSFWEARAPLSSSEVTCCSSWVSSPHVGEVFLFLVMMKTMRILMCLSHPH